MRLYRPVFVALFSVLAAFASSCRHCQVNQPISNVEADREAAGAIKLSLQKIATSGDLSGSAKTTIKQNFQQLSDQGQACLAMANFALCLVKDKHADVRQAGIDLVNDYGKGKCNPQFQPLLREFQAAGVALQ